MKNLNHNLDVIELLSKEPNHKTLQIIASPEKFPSYEGHKNHVKILHFMLNIARTFFKNYSSIQNECHFFGIKGSPKNFDCDICYKRI